VVEAPLSRARYDELEVMNDSVESILGKSVFGNNPIPTALGSSLHPTIMSEKIKMLSIDREKNGNFIDKI